MIAAATKLIGWHGSGGKVELAVEAFSSHWHPLSNLFSCSFDHRTLVDGGCDSSSSGAALGLIGRERPCIGHRWVSDSRFVGSREAYGGEVAAGSSALGDVDVIEIQRRRSRPHGAGASGGDDADTVGGLLTEAVRSLPLNGRLVVVGRSGAEKSGGQCTPNDRPLTTPSSPSFVRWHCWLLLSVVVVSLVVGSLARVVPPVPRGTKRVLSCKNRRFQFEINLVIPAAMSE